MLNKDYLLPIDALNLMINNVIKRDLEYEILKIEECYNRILAEDICSPEDLPAFSRSTVDGYAVSSEDTYGASESTSVYIMVKYDIPMGVVPDFKIGELEGSRIATGAMLPDGADAVVMIENAQVVSNDMIEVTKPVASGENVIQKGEDFKVGETILKRGSKLRPQDIGALAAVGITHIKVYKKPLVSIISTGDEVIPHYSPLSPGKIRDINSLTLAGLVQDNGGIALKKGIVIDDYKMIKDILEKSIIDSDLVLISGGTSAGTKDLIGEIINDIGEPGILFHGLSLKPGKPMIGGVINNIPVFALPGHPVAVFICFDIIVRPILEFLGGFKNNKFPFKTTKAKIAKNVASIAGREDHISVYIEDTENGLIAYPILGKSGLISVLTRGEGRVVIPSFKTGLDAGDEVEVNIY